MGSPKTDTRLTARVTSETFRGVPDGEVYPVTFRKGALLYGELAAVAIQSLAADRVSGPSGVTEVTKDFSRGPAAQPSSPRPVPASRPKILTMLKPAAKTRAKSKTKSRK